MQRRSFLKATAGAGLASAPSLANAQAKQPNVVLILFDDLSWRDFSSYGHDYHRTPNIDALAKEGMRFTNAYAACPVCSPTRSSVMTGKYPVRTGVTDWIPGRAQWPTAKLLTPRTTLQMKLEEVTLAERMKQAGYATAAIGKWHLGGEGFGPTEQGFDYNVGGNHRGSNPYFGPFQLPGLENRTKQDYLTDELMKAARAWVDTQVGGRKPFFLFSPNYSVHTPIQAPEDRIPQTPGKTALQRTYQAMLEITDQHIGRLREQLKQSGEYENTIWIVTSDNGGLRYEGKNPVPHTVNAPLRAGKGHLYEGGIRVPLIVAGPGVKRGESNALVASVDIMPTVLSLTGQAAQTGIDGVDVLRPVKRPALYWHYPHYSNQGGVPGGAMREGNWKLIEFYEDSRLELFNLAEDPGETKNLAKREAKRAAAMREKLEQWRKASGAILPTANPGYKAGGDDQGLAGTEQPTPAL
ncbi:MAG: sulfatase [Bryobacter sp.]